ncbi:MAG: 1-deoxy-D-xylulose-5-phosphate reductoisomerase [Gammaproteobacteria bacterium]
MKNVVVLGASGSIGRNTVDVIERNPERYRLFAVAARRSVDAVAEQCRRHRPDYAALADAEAAARLAAKLKTEGVATEVLAGPEALAELAAHSEADYVMAGIVGAAGLAPTLAAARAGKRVLLANKEALVMTGPLFLAELVHGGGELIPIDSEHNALFQGMPGGYRAGTRPEGVTRLWLTCSGGPFRGRHADELRGVTPDQACAHPRWKMGRKISVDSATLMNKSLEVIEASYLFGMKNAEIEIVVHPQSMVHSLVEYCDGSFLAQLGQADMRTSIACGLAWPERVVSGAEPLDLTRLGDLGFEAPDVEAFPCLRLGREALTTGATAPAVLNAANEIAVAAFLAGKLDFADIPQVIEQTLSATATPPARDLETVLGVDAEARARAGASAAALALALS